MLTPGVPATDVGELTVGRVLRRHRLFGGFNTFLQETQHLEVRRARRSAAPNPIDIPLPHG